MKKCTKCDIEKPLNEFSKDTYKKTGLKSWCKICANTHNINRRRTIKGKLIEMYKDQVTRSKNNDYGLPTYTKDDFIDYWIDNPLYIELYTNWVNSGYKKDLAPSIDRIDNYKGYSFENTQLMTSIENILKGTSDMKSGINNKQNTAIIMTDVDGTETEFYSINHGARQTNIPIKTIHHCLNRDTPLKNGVNFRYKILKVR
jgi:hypothetical protein